MSMLRLQLATTLFGEALELVARKGEAAIEGLEAKLIPLLESVVPSMSKEEVDAVLERVDEIREEYGIPLYMPLTQDNRALLARADALIQARIKLGVAAPAEVEARLAILDLQRPGGFATRAERTAAYERVLRAVAVTGAERPN